MKKRIGIVLGTRPDAIKMAPVVLELRRHSHEFDPVVISTGQHRQMLVQVLQVFEVGVDVELDLMQHNQTLSALTCRILTAMDTLLTETPLDCLLVQGDTTTAFAAALAAFYKQVPVGHIEAGLRTGNIFQPWPEEANRKLAAGSICGWPGAAIRVAFKRCASGATGARAKAAGAHLIIPGSPSRW